MSAGLLVQKYPPGRTSQDMKVAAIASKNEAEARQELARQTYERISGQAAGSLLSNYA